MAKRLRYIGAGIPGGGQWGARKSRRGAGGGQPRAIREGRPSCRPSRQLQAAVGVRLRCFTPGRVSVEHCRRSPRRRQPPACLSLAAPQAVHDDLVAAVSLAAYDHMGDYDGTASPQVYGTQPAASAQSATGASRRVGTLIRSGPPLRGGQTRGGDWRSVQVRFEFVNPEHLALNSGSGSLQPPVEILWRAYCRADLGPPDWWRTRRGVQGRPRPVLRLPRRRTRRATLRARGPR